VFQIATADGLLLASTDPIVFAPGEQRAIVLEARTGVLEVRLPDDLAPQDAAALRVDVRPVGMPWRVFTWADWHREPPPGRKSRGAWSGPASASGRVGEGTWTARVEILPARGSASATRGDAAPIPAVERTITIRAGETTVFDLR
jgi:hypothetical protein